eukprot:2439820-Ditylum_brightwellii.AAC.1
MKQPLSTPKSSSVSASCFIQDAAEEDITDDEEMEYANNNKKEVVVDSLPPVIITEYEETDSREGM